MISINDLSISFDQKLVLNKLNAQFNQPQIIGIAGLNGAGKSTLFNVLSGLIKTDKDVIMQHQSQLDFNTIAYLETNNFFYSNITGNEYLQIFKSSNANFQLDVFKCILSCH